MKSRPTNAPQIKINTKTSHKIIFMSRLKMGFFFGAISGLNSNTVNVSKTITPAMVLVTRNKQLAFYKLLPVFSHLMMSF